MQSLSVLRTRGRALATGLLMTAVMASAAIVAPAAIAGPANGVPPAGISFTAQGATPKGSDGRYQFVYNNVTPGTTIKDWVELYNLSPASEPFQVYATDATGTTLTNSLVYLKVGSQPSDVGSWVAFYESPTKPGVTTASFVLGAKRGIIEPFTITVPSNARPGDHTGGVAAEIAVIHSGPNGEQVTQFDRIVLPVLLRVTGPLKAGIQVQSVSTSYSNPVNPFGPGSATISYSVLNTGNVRISGTQLVKVSGLFAQSAVTPPHLPTILPGDSVRITTKVGGLYPAGPFTATVTVTPDASKSALPASISATLKSSSQSASFFAVPWALIVVIILLAGLGYGTYRLLRWRARQRVAVMRAVAAQARKDAEKALATQGASTSSSSRGAKPGTTAAKGSSAPATVETASTGTGTATATADPGPATTAGDPAPDGQGDAE